MEPLQKMKLRLGVRKTSFVLFTPYVCFHILVKFLKRSGCLLRKLLLTRLTIRFHSMCLIFNLVFATSIFGAPFPDHCLPFFTLRCTVFTFQKVVRDVLCDVWITQRNDWPPHALGNPRSTWEWYFATVGGHDLSLCMRKPTI